MDLLSFLDKEPWLINGIMEYFCNTNSSRIVEILVKVQSPHDTYIFDRLVHWMNGSNKNEAITLFGHIVKHHPSWLYKVANHQLFKDILKLLKVIDLHLFHLFLVYDSINNINFHLHCASPRRTSF